MSSNGDSATPAMHLALVGLAAALLVLLPPHRLAPAQVARIEVDPASVLPGDLVFRRGRSMISRAVLSIDGESEFSHVGIALSEGRIVHAVPPEEESTGGVVEEALETFLTPELASAAAVYRPSDPGIGFRAAARAWEYARRRRPFDSGFDLSTPGAVYCTELVWRAYLEEGVDLAGRDFRERYLLPSHLLASPDLRLIQEYR